ncbi:hypothetical protein V8B97DRAFT_1933149, partial [Scleroderma yunnanense]
MVGRGSGLKGKAPSTISPSEHLKLQATWSELKQEYYAVSTIVSGLGLAYSVEKGADIVTEVGQLVIDDLVETQPDISQFQSKGFRYLECMQQFVPPSKVRGTNAHYFSNTHSYFQPSQPPTSTSFNTSSST